MKISINIVLVAILGFSNCDKKKESPTCNENTLNTYKFFPPNSPKASVQNVDNSIQIINLKIETQQDYEKFIFIRPDTVRPDLEFSTKVLLAGKSKLTSSGEIGSQKVFIKCDTVFFQVELRRGNLAVLTDVSYFALINKPTLPVKFDVKLK